MPRPAPGEGPRPAASCAPAREAAARGAWEEAFAAYAAADADGACGAGDLARWATSGYLVGRVEAAIAAMSRAHDAHLAEGDVPAAVRCGFWVVFMLLGHGEPAQAGGWLARCAHEADDLAPFDAARGYPGLLQAQRLVALEHRYEEGTALADEAAGAARRRDEPDLLALALMVAGRGRIRAGRAREGFAMLDEAMVGVVRGEVSPIAAGTVYCSVIEACGEVAELRRAVEWTDALTAWCDRQQGMVTFTGRCLTHRAAVLMLRGDWDAALDEAEHACARFAGAADEAATGEALYLLAELHRLTGREGPAERAFGQARDWGRDPQPGLALLRLAQGRGDAAAATVRRLLDERHTAVDRVGVLPAAVDVLLATGDVGAAARAADELDGLADELGTPGLRAAAARAAGAVLLARDLPADALGRLREAAETWRSVGAVYEVARTRLLVAEACRRLGDHDTADLERAAARRRLDELGAVPDRTGPEPGASAADRLTAREREVLRLVATGMTNREVADHLTIAVRTVDRHVTHILAKLGVTSRTAATTVAHERGLI